MTVTRGQRLIIAGFIEYHPPLEGCRQLERLAYEARMELPVLSSRITRFYVLPNLRLMCADLGLDPDAPDAGTLLAQACRADDDDGSSRRAPYSYHPSHIDPAWFRAQFKQLAAGFSGDLPALSAHIKAAKRGRDQAHSRWQRLQQRLSDLLT